MSYCGFNQQTALKQNIAREQVYMFRLGWAELAIILIAMILVFGPKKIPEIGSTLGKTLRGFKEEVDLSEENSSDEDL